jgi:DNA-binding beta-propeller fold protein YncE
VAVLAAAVAAPLSVAGTAGATAPAAVQVTVGRFPDGIAVDPVSHVAYVINGGNNTAVHGNGTLSVVDGTSVTTTKVGGTPVGVAVDPTTGEVYVAVYNADSFLLGITATGETKQALQDPEAVEVDPATGDVWVLEAARKLVRFEGTHRTTYTLQGAFPDELALNPTTGAPYVLSTDGVLDSLYPDGKVDVQRLGGDAVGMSIDPTTGEIYVAHSSYFAGGVLHPAIVSELRGFFLDQVDLGDFDLGGIAAGPTPGSVQVTEDDFDDTAFGQLATVSGQTVSTSPLPGGPRAIAVDPTDGASCIAQAGAQAVDVVQGSTVTTVAAGGAPDLVTVDPGAGTCWAVDPMTDTVVEVPLP